TDLSDPVPMVVGSASPKIGPFELVDDEARDVLADPGEARGTEDAGQREGAKEIETGRVDSRGLSQGRYGEPRRQAPANEIGRLGPMDLPNGGKPHQPGRHELEGVDGVGSNRTDLVDPGILEVASRCFSGEREQGVVADVTSPEGKMKERPGQV